MVTEGDAAGLHYRELGGGRPLVLLHPGPGLDGSVFFPWFERLAGRHRLIALDLPAAGRSEPPPSEQYTIEGCAHAVQRFAESLELGEYDLLGHSFGSHVALTHAVEYPGAAARVVASCGAATESVFDDFEQRIAGLEPPEIRDRVVAALEREENVETPGEMHEVWIDQLPLFLADVHSPLIERLDREWRGVAYRAEWMQHEDWGHYDVTAELPQVRVPVLAIGGRHDRATPPEATEQIAALAPNAQAVIVEDAGHFPYAEQPDAYFEALERFLEDAP